MGLNMLTIASFSISQYFMQQFPDARYYPRSNFTSDKKSSFMNLLNSYGKEVVCEVIIPSEILQKYAGIDVYTFDQVWRSCIIGSYEGGVLGHNAQVANSVAAIYLATGQDIAQVSNATTAFTFCEVVNGGLRVSLKFHSLPVGTIGGGTGLPSQRDALRILGCVGVGSSRRLAEIISVTSLAGEISLMCTIALNSHAKADVALRNRT